jgi:PDZ domain-containing protein
VTYFSDTPPDPNDPYAAGSGGHRSIVRSIVGYALLVILAALILVGAYLPAPYAIERPGPAFNVLGQNNKTPIITVSGAPTYATQGSLDLLTVELLGSPGHTPTWFDLAGAYFDKSQNILPIDEAFPPNQSTVSVNRQNALMFQDSQQQATAVALNALGYQYKMQIYVDSLATNGPATKLLQKGDIILKVAGKTVQSIDGLRSLVQTTKGKPVEVQAVRAGKAFTVQITPISTEGKWRVGIFAGSRFDFPIDVNLQLADVGGPSGGTMFALGIYDKMTPGSLTGGQLIAGTGTIDQSGQVGPIGGIRQKLYGAVRAGATWFLAPASNCDEVVGHIPDGIQVVSIKTFTDALTAVKQIAAKKSIAGLPTCSAN